MTTNLPELRRWSRKNGHITGYVYNDPKDIYDNGEHAVIGVGEMLDKGLYYLLRQYGSDIRFFKLMKDDEIVR